MSSRPCLTSSTTIWTWSTQPMSSPHVYLFADIVKCYPSTVCPGTSVYWSKTPLTSILHHSHSIGTNLLDVLNYRRPSQCSTPTAITSQEICCTIPHSLHSLNTKPKPDHLLAIFTTPMGTSQSCVHRDQSCSYHFLLNNNDHLLPNEFVVYLWTVWVVSRKMLLYS